MKVDYDGFGIASRREKGGAIWHHRLYKGDYELGEIIDFVDSEMPVLVRKCNLKNNIRIILNVWDFPQVSCIPNSSSYPKAGSALLVCKSPGLNFMQSYNFPFEQYHQIIIKGNCRLTETDSKDFFNIDLDKGESEIYIIGGTSLSECVTNTEAIMDMAYASIFQRTRKYWDEFTARRTDFSKMIPDKNRDKEKFLQVADDISVLLKTQQAAEGSVLAGSAYHMGYIRDQYGVSRGFLALGYYAEARSILNFYWNVWKKYGVLHNAQSIGIDGIFHIHENDEVEITGYLIVQAFDYFERTKDEAFLKEIFPMLEWAWRVQKRNLVKYMLPFNGDETYVAGGILPRYTLNDGSSEATLLFAEGGRKLLSYAKGNNLMNTDSLANDHKILLATIAKYHENFIENGKLMTNNPARKDGIELPRFRRGVCENHGYLGYTQRNDNGRYLCPKCFVTNHDMPAAPATKFFLPSISITPLYIGSTLLTKEEIKFNLDDILNAYRKTKQITSLPGSNRTIGYEFGYLLYAMIEFNDPLAKEVYHKMIDAIDQSGAWVEYYDNGKPVGCRYRPWESAINIEAAVKFMIK